MNTRVLSIKCAKHNKTLLYINKVCHNIKVLIYDYANAKKLDQLHTLQSYCCFENKIKSAGQFNKKYVLDVIEKGNIREQMTFIMNFAIKGCYIIIWAITKKHKLLNINNSKKLHQKLYYLTGLNNLKKIENYIISCDECLLPCKFISLATNGAVMSSRMTSFPMIETLRSQSSLKESEKYKVNINNVYPPLSHREKEYMNITNEKYLPWITGQNHWNPNKNNFYIQWMTYHKQEYISGPSGNADLQLSIFTLFNNFNMKYAILSLIAWMCNPPDHSPCEILLAAIPFGLKWTIEKNSFEYINNLSQK